MNGGVAAFSRAFLDVLQQQAQSESENESFSSSLRPPLFNPHEAHDPALTSSRFRLRTFRYLQVLRLSSRRWTKLTKLQEHNTTS
jgi:hypothetical protein